MALGAACVMAGFIIAFARGEISGMIIFVGFVIVGSEMHRGGF